MSTKGCLGIIFFCLDLELFAKIKKNGFCTLVFNIFINNSRSKENQKKSEHAFVDIVNLGTCAKFQQKILNFVAVAALLKVFNFSDK